MQSLGNFNFVFDFEFISWCVYSIFLSILFIFLVSNDGSGGCYA